MRIEKIEYCDARRQACTGGASGHERYWSSKTTRICRRCSARICCSKASRSIASPTARWRSVGPASSCPISSSSTSCCRTSTGSSCAAPCGSTAERRLILTARSQKADKLRGLNLGADDYITKPFDLDEFLARVNAVLRRSRPSADTLHLGPVSIDFLARTARQGKREIHLTHREFELLKYLAERPGHVVSRDELLREVWEYPDGALTRSVDHAIARLRRKIELDPQQPRFIHTAVGTGYSLIPEMAAGPARKER